MIPLIPAEYVPEPDIDLSHFIAVSSIVLSVCQRIVRSGNTDKPQHAAVSLNQGAFSQCVLESGRNM